MAFFKSLLYKIIFSAKNIQWLFIIKVVTFPGGKKMEIKADLLGLLVIKIRAEGKEEILISHYRIFFWYGFTWRMSLDSE